jgi:hypothetical protein
MKKIILHLSMVILSYGYLKSCAGCLLGLGLVFNNFLCGVSVDQHQEVFHFLLEGLFVSFLEPVVDLFYNEVLAGVCKGHGQLFNQKIIQELRVGFRLVFSNVVFHLQ